MAVRVRYKTEVVVSSTSAEERDLGQPQAYVVSDTLGEGGSWKTTLPAGAVDQPLIMPNIASIRALWVRTNSKDPTVPLTGILVRRNLITGEQQPIEPLPGAREGQWFMTTNNLNALFASNPGIGDIEVTISVAGD